MKSTIGDVRCQNCSCDRRVGRFPFAFVVKNQAYAVYEAARKDKSIWSLFHSDKIDYSELHRRIHAKYPETAKSEAGKFARTMHYCAACYMYRAHQAPLGNGKGYAYCTTTGEKLSDEQVEELRKKYNEKKPFVYRI